MATATSEVQPIEQVSAVRPHWRWYHAVVFYGVIQILTFGLSGLVSLTRGNKGQSLREATFGDVSYFERLKQVKITPPSWAFGPAWLVNNIAVLWGTWQVLNKPRQTPGRTAYLALQGASWIDFVLFNAAYFSLRSPLNALALTFVMFLLTIASGVVAIFRLKDTKVALSLATLFVWLIVALTAATFQALWNKDDFYQVGPFVKPMAGLVKKEAMGVLEGKVAVITGSSRGLGLAIAQAYVREGAAVVLAGRSSAALAEAAAACERQGARVSWQVTEVGDLEQVKALADHTVKMFGKIDIWVNNAGYAGVYGPTAAIDPQDARARRAHQYPR